MSEAHNADELKSLRESVSDMHRQVVSLNDQLDVQAAEIASLKRNLSVASTWINELLGARS